ncbi:PTS sugar transporter subunit IIB [Candidatus Palauibacter polyketidifaciens]|uniref:PTS sugar transporter subunit IIB n=1 Tax=Candidatus Palauibacter polyketidifaciens TaxID=3056740 RepID=UPI00139D9571|nr:PTS sugar transporter subunit IIB [Candidatus Palauibacter polyketidifaciens]MDE2719646.1 PTS sugar transporter subunit IIB [Candidatus Palauibacter polyketidifaciens]MYE33448.1 PTS sugar transporter subunit IIB [Gemmatimonadales bacterium]
MPLELLRIDERLIHGQVLVGWGRPLDLDFYIVVDDALASSEWEQELWASALADEESAEFLGVDEAIRRFGELGRRAERGALLTRDTRTMRALAEPGCLDGRTVNVGGVYAAEGRKKILDYVHLSPEEIEDLRVIGERASVSARSLPTQREVRLDARRLR